MVENGHSFAARESQQGLVKTLRDIAVVELLMRFGVYRMIELREESPEVKEKFQSEVVKGAWPVSFSDHQSHVDVFGMALVAERLTQYMREVGFSEEEFKGFRLPAAVSMETGDQGPFLQRAYARTKEMTPKRNLYPFNIIRKKDEIKYKIPRTNKDILAEIRQYTRAREEGFGVAIFPEGSVEGGRENGEGGIQGVQDAADNSLAQMFKIFTRKGGRVIFVPVRMDGGFKAFSPDNKTTNLTSVKGAIGLHGKLISATMRMPLTGEEILKEVAALNNGNITEEAINRFLMEKVA